MPLRGSSLSHSPAVLGLVIFGLLAGFVLLQAEVGAFAKALRNEAEAQVLEQPLTSPEAIGLGDGDGIQNDAGEADVQALGVGRMQRVLDEESRAMAGAGVDESVIPLPTELLGPSLSDSTTKSASSKKEKETKERQPRRQTKKERLRRRKEAQKRAKEATGEDVGWIRALFNQIDTDADGYITVAEMRSYATKLKLPRHFMHDFELYAVGHPAIQGMGSSADGTELNALPKVSGASRVDFDAFLMALHQKDNMLMRACTQGSSTGGTSLLDEVQERGLWLVGLLVLQSVSGVVLQRYEDMLSRHVIITVFLTMLVGAGGNAGNQSAIKIIEGIAIGEVMVDFASFVKHMMRELTVGLMLAVVVAIGGFVRTYATHGFNHGAEGFQNVMAVTICLSAIVLVAALVGTALPFMLGALDVDPAHAGTVVQVLMDVIGVVITCTVCELALRNQNGNNGTALARAISWLGSKVVGAAGGSGRAHHETGEHGHKDASRHDEGVPIRPIM